MQYTELVAITAIFQFLFFGAMTGHARRLSGLEAPAISGHASFERMYRVQMNTLELLVAFLPSLLLAGKYWSSLLVPSLGVVYLVGRFAYWRAYVSDPSTRRFGFMMSLLPTALLTAMAFVGVALPVSGLVP